VNPLVERCGSVGNEVVAWACPPIPAEAMVSGRMSDCQVKVEVPTPVLSITGNKKL
jgi:hypothetical protein